MAQAVHLAIDTLDRVTPVLKAVQERAPKVSLPQCSGCPNQPATQR